MANTYTLIASNTLSSSAASVTFSSIPGTYTDLVLKYSARGDNGGINYDNSYLRFNGDSSSLYSNTNLFVNNTTITSNRLSDIFIEGIMDVNGSTSTSNTFSNSEIYIPNYTSTTSKQISRQGVVETNGTPAYLGVVAGLYRNTSAITSLTLTSYFSSNFVAGSSFFLYGIKNS